MKCLSGMIGNFHVPFLEEGGRVIALLYSASLVFQHLFILPQQKTNSVCGIGFLKEKVLYIL